MRSAALAMGGSNQSLFLLGALLLAQGSAAVPLLVVGLLLSLAAMPGWIELLLMFPNRVGGIAAVCGEAFRPYSAVLANLAGTCYWWGWVPTCGLTALLSAAALHTWYLPFVPVVPLAVAILLLFTGLNLLGIRKVTTVAVGFAAVAASLSFLSVLLPIVSGHVDWEQATSYSLRSPFGGTFGGITSAMAGLYLIGFAAPAFEAAGCHVGETINPNRNIPRAFYVSAAMAVLFFVAVPVVWLGVIGPTGLEGDLIHTLGPTFAPLAGAAARGAVVWLVVINMFHGTLQPLAGASRTLSQLSEDGLLPRFLARRSRRDVPWVATAATAGMSIVFLLLGDPVWMIAAANLTYLIGISLPSVAVWLLRRHSPDLKRPYRAPRGTIVLGVGAAGVWGVSAVLGFEQFGLPTVVFGIALAYSGAALYALRKRADRRRSGQPSMRGSLHRKLTGAMLVVLTLDSVGYLVAVRYAGRLDPEINTVLADIFVAVSLVTISVGLVLPGLISHAVSQVATAAQGLASGTLADLTWAMESLAAGDLDTTRPSVVTRHVVVHSADELGAMAKSFNTMQDEVTRASTALGGAREQLLSSRTTLEYLAETDPLTAVSNRRHFKAELDAEVAATARSGQSAALLVLDLDNFKYMNDSHGHAVGDAVLRRIADTMKKRLRITDVIGRLGGDEFAVLLRNVNAAQAEVIARDLLDAIRATRVMLESGAETRLTVSIGITTFDGEDRVGAADLLVNADIAMYDAKEAGRDRLSIATAGVHQERMKSRQRWLERIRDALDQGRMELHAQPILHLASGKITQYELLIRMRSDSGEIIPPAAFLEIAERSGMIRDIDLWVVRTACQLIAAARSAGRQLRLEINVSGVSVSDPAFLQLIEPELVRIQPHAANLVFELTETAAIVDLKNATDFATGLARHGCTLALDDFGAGFGSFYYLKHLPCRYLKIDGEFIRNLPNSAVDQVFVRSMVELATGLGKLTIAEFVEDGATMGLLRELGVDYAQGYHVGRPAPLPADAGEPVTAFNGELIA
ncbi:MAG: amino acid permease [Actinomycetota bacterium]|nr:amino acid permease [Actinomycetota bacterium]